MTHAASSAPGPRGDLVPVLDVRGLTVGFPGVGDVVREVELRVVPGECLAVVGESGAGKSVLARSLIGLASEGGASASVRAERFTVAGQDVLNASRRQWRRLRGGDVGFVLQDALQSLDPLRTIGAEVGETLRLRGVGGPERRRRVIDALRRAGLDEPGMRIAQRSDELSGGMRQRALIASAIVTGPRLLIADEPTTALDATVARGVLDLLGSLRDDGAAVLLVSHDLAAVARLADRIAVMADGRIVESGPAPEVLGDPRHPRTRQLIAAIPRGPRRRTGSGAAPPDSSEVPDGAVGAVGDSVTPGGVTPGGVTPPAAPEPEPVLRARGLRHRYRLPGRGQVTALDDVSLDVHAGEAVGVVGESGSGKSTLARMLLAAETPDAGTVELAGEPWSGGSERRRRPRRGLIRLIPQDPLGSFDPRLDAGRILAESSRVAGTGRSPAELLDLVHLPAATVHRRPRALSGGQRQRLAIARALAADPRVLVCDEPVSALDVTVQARILDLLVEVQERTGLALVFISHDLAVVRRVCDTVAVMRSGRIVESGPLEQVWHDPSHPFTRELLAAVHR